MPFPVSDLADPRWFGADLHVPDGRFGMLRLQEDVIERSSFLDHRIEASLADVVPCMVSEVAGARLPPGRIAWLFHTSFCASTLLARALHVAPFVTSLKEPLVLRRLSDARHAGRTLESLVAPTVALLGRPWHPGGAVVIKPTHVALRIAVDLMAATPGRAVILTSSLEEFLISNLKKLPASQEKIPALIERMLQGSSFAARLSPVALRPPDLSCAAGLQWAATRELVRDVVDAVGPDRVRVLDMQPLLIDLPSTVVNCAQWLELPVPADIVRARAAEAGKRNAKALEVAYGPQHRAYEAQIVIHYCGDTLRRALAWTHAHVLPAMRPEARATPAPWSAGVAPISAHSARRDEPVQISWGMGRRGARK
jgi:hypothetical protein